MLSLTYIYSTRYQFNNSSFLTVYPVTVHIKCSEFPSHSSPADSATVHHGLSHSFTGPGATANVLTDLKIALLNCLFTSSLN